MIYVFGGTKSRKAAAISVFLISAVVHEYVLAFSFRFLYPLLLVMFGGIGSKSFFTLKLIIVSISQLLAYTSKTLNFFLHRSFFCLGSKVTRRR